MSGALESVATVINGAFLAYFVALNVIYTVLLGCGWRAISAYVRRRPLIDYAAIARSELTTPMSVMVPAFDEEPLIVDSVRALLDARYPNLEVVVINDGSRDGTLAALRDAFDLVEVERVPRARLDTAAVRAIYACPTDDRLVVIDKVNGGKADSINAGLCYARYPLFCTIDSDTIIDDDAFLRLVKPFQLHPDTVACGGVVRIVNGSRVEGSRVVDVRTPRTLLGNIQIVEYLRAFLAGRTGWSRLGALLIISGAFGVFRRDVVIAAGGYDPTTVGEDAELVVRLHRYCRDQKRPYRIVFLADPVCWTQAPSSLRVLCRQRDRWHRGLIETLLRHRGMVGRRRYGVIGTFAMPYFIIFEALGPLIEVIGYTVFGASLAAGVVEAEQAVMLLLLSLTYGLFLSFGALLLEEHAFSRYRSRRCALRMIGAAVIENFGYRQLVSVVRAWSFVTLACGRSGWGDMRRGGFQPSSPATAPATAPLASGPAGATVSASAMHGES